MKVKASAEEQERRQRILVAAWRLMSQKGIKAVTMDELTVSLAMSKRTIYELLHDKKAIVRGLLMELSLPEKMKSVPQEGDALEYLLKMMLKGWNAYRTVSPLFFRDLETYYPEVWKEYTQFVQQRHCKQLEKRLTKGIKEGVFRAEIDVRAVALILVESSMWMMHYQAFSESTQVPARLLGQFYALLVYGVVASSHRERVTHFFAREMK